MTSDNGAVAGDGRHVLVAASITDSGQTEVPGA